MQDLFTLPLDFLTSLKEMPLEGSVAPLFLEDDAFLFPVTVKGKACIVDDALILTLYIETAAHLPCIICEEKVAVPIVIENFTLAEEVASLPSLFSFKEAVREEILLNLPLVAECAQGSCPERASMAQYFRKKGKKEDPPAHYPFANIGDR